MPFTTVPTADKMMWGNRTLDFSKGPVIMGILNVTPDSFFPGSRAATRVQATESAEAMIAAGADIIDIGGESTRPGSDAVPAAQELERVVPVIREIRRRHDILISVDTRKQQVAQAALDAGADILNTVSALKGDDTFAEFIAGRDVPVVLMHMRGTPQTMQQNPLYEDTITEISGELKALVRHAVACGIKRERIIIDPGIGFGKRLEDNLRIIKHLPRLKALGYPLLIGISRKSFIGAVLDKPVEQRLIGTVTANTVAVLNGADIIRVHDVAEAREMAGIIRAIQTSS